MIENQSDKVENLEENVSEDVKNNENSSVNENQINDDKQSPEIDDEKTYTDDLKDTITNNDARLEQLEKEHETLKGQYVRIAADFDNFRKRQSRDQDDLKVQLVSKALTAILPIVDNFERARQQLKPESEEAQPLHRSYQGLYKQLVEVLKQQGVSPMRVVNQQFDPKLHEAVLREPSQEFNEDIITEELQRGYHLEGKVLRHALVKVSMGPGQQNSQEPEEKDKVEEEIDSESSISEEN
jgi:molecular chaperone GrpE